MTIADNLEEKLKELVMTASHEDFIYEFLLLYGTPKATVTRMRQGHRPIAGKGFEHAIIVKQKMFFVPLPQGADIVKEFEFFKAWGPTYAHKPRFIVVTDFQDFCAVDTKNKDLSLKIKFQDLYRNYEFFHPLAGKERYHAHQENPADVKAAEKMAKVYDEIVLNNRELAKEHTHDLNIFLTRLLFCFFAEDTGIFKEENLFTKSLYERTNSDGSDFSAYLEMLFSALDTRDKSKYPSHVEKFPYVNGRLFSGRYKMPAFTAKIRSLIIECGDELCWADINPDIFGSMFQAVSVKEVRASLGQHYTSVPNIMKVIRPLFLDELYESFEKAKDNAKGLQKLLNRMGDIKIFDPACGSGNFLIIAYKQLRLLEIEIIKRIEALGDELPFNYSHILLKNFFGIEIDDFACEIARLSLYLAQHQMNRKVEEELNTVQPTLPLAESGHIVCGNATRIDWDTVCPRLKSPNNLQAVIEQAEIKSSPLKLEISEEYNEIYVLGNPPYVGFTYQSPEQKADMACVFDKTKNYKLLDYIACWLHLLSKYITNIHIQGAFVSTNSICQGEQVSLLWPPVFARNIEIRFAHLSFKWTNNAKSQAGVTCIVLGLGLGSNSKKFIFKDGIKNEVEKINAYLSSAKNIIVDSRRKTLSNIPPITYGNKPNDGGNLIMSPAQKDDLLRDHPSAKIFLRPLLGSKEFIRGEQRWCLWLKDNELLEAQRIQFIAKRIEQVRLHRTSSKDEGARLLARRAHQFRDTNEAKEHSIIVPVHSSERREYIPIGFLDKDTVISNAAMAIYDAELWVFAIVTSRMHMVWVRAVGGRLETRLRYSAELCYNTFPFPEVSDKQKKELEYHARQVLAERENHSEKTMAELYDPNKMPEGLRRAHNSLDIAVEQCYRRRPFDSDETRLEYLFKLYEKMVAGQKLNTDQLELL